MQKPNNVFPDEPQIHILPNLFTAGNLICGFFAILTIFQGISEGTSNGGNYNFDAAYTYYQQATYYIFASCIFDLLDGRIARMSGQEGPFGREFDSLADIVSFGIAPALLVSKAVLFAMPHPWIGWGIGILYLLCAALRLARFNCMAAEQKKEGQSSDFIGLPVPMAAGAIVSAMFLIIHLHRQDTDIGIYRYVLAGAIVLISFLMMSRVIYPSFKHIHFRTKGTLLSIVGTVAVIGAMVSFPWIMPAVLFAMYLCYGLIIRPWLNRRWQRLIEAESDEETGDISS